MLAFASECSGSILNVGIRGDDDLNAILVCAGHRERLRSLRPREAETLCRYLRVSFGRVG